MLKQQTAAGRQFRAAEYEVGVAAVRGGSIYGQRRAGLGPAGIEAANEFETFMQSQTQVTLTRSIVPNLTLLPGKLNLR